MNNSGGRHVTPSALCQGVSKPRKKEAFICGVYCIPYDTDHRVITQKKVYLVEYLEYRDLVDKNHRLCQNNKLKV